MLGFEVRKKLPRRPNLPLLHIVEALPDALLRAGGGGNVEKMLMGGGVLNDGRGLSLWLGPATLSRYGVRGDQFGGE